MAAVGSDDDADDAEPTTPAWTRTRMGMTTAMTMRESEEDEGSSNDEDVGENGSTAVLLKA